MKVVVLCGGKGVRSFPFTQYMPKPMLPIGGAPVVAHLIRNFIRQGITSFVLAAGYRQSVLRDYFEGKQFGAEIELLDTGEDADTGERVLRCREVLGERFMVTYADGLCDVPLDRLLDFHAASGGLATVTCVPMRSQYGVLDVDATGRVELMREKPLMADHWVNAGFMVMEHGVFDQWHGTSLERDMLPVLTAQQKLFAYRHDGFFKSVDSYKDVMEFEELMEAGDMPWIVRS
jgi:glucose-1-phosphate cytidylyltransferase